MEVVDPECRQGRRTDHAIARRARHRDGAAISSKGFITNGQSNSVTIFDLKTLEKTGEPATGKNPDAICYEPKTQRVFTINGSSQRRHRHRRQDQRDASRPFPIGEKPEFCVVDGAGKLYVNIEDSSEIVEIDAAKAERDAARLAGSVRRSDRPRHRREEQEALLACAATR